MTSKTNVNVCLTDEIRLEKALKGAGVEKSASVRKLTVCGKLTEADFCYICENMAETLLELDLGDAVVENNILDDACLGVIYVTINDRLEKIIDYSFRDCTGLISITIPKSVTIIRSAAFYGCTGLTSVTIPDTVTGIEFDAFGDCISLKSITIPKSVTEIGDEAFSGCLGLTSVKILNPDIKIYKDTFKYCDASITIYPIPTLPFIWD